MTRRVALPVLALLVLILLAAPLAAEAQAPPRLARIGFLWIGSPGATASSRLEAFKTGLRELGYVEGQNFAFYPRFGEDSSERLAAAADELVRGVDLIVTSGDASVRAAKRATGTLPIVVAISGDLVEAGHAASLARPGGT